MQITKEHIYQNLLLLLKYLFRLPGAKQAQIRDFILLSPQETNTIKQGVDACYHDILSDIDISLYTSDPEPIRPEQLGFTRETLLGLSRQRETLTDGGQYTLFRAILKNGMRYDIGIYQPESQKPTETTRKTAKRTTAEITKTVAEATDQAAKTTEQITELALELEKADSFWFIAVQALAKLYRRDYLIADHLTNLLINETLAAQMIERDKQYGTTIHRYGYAEKLAYREAIVPSETDIFYPWLSVSAQSVSTSNVSVSIQDRKPVSKLMDETFLYIADRLFRAAAAYDRLTSAALPAYEERRTVFYELWSCYHADILQTHASSMLET